MWRGVYVQDIYYTSPRGTTLDSLACILHLLYILYAVKYNTSTKCSLLWEASQQQSNYGIIPRSYLMRRRKRQEMSLFPADRLMHVMYITGHLFFRRLQAVRGMHGLRYIGRLLRYWSLKQSGIWYMILCIHPKLALA